MCGSPHPSLEKRANNSSGLLAVGGSPIQVLCAGFAAVDGKACTQHKPLANCRRVPIYRACAVMSHEESRPEGLPNITHSNMTHRLNS